MAQKNLTFLIIPECTSRVKQFKLSRLWFRFTVWFFAITLIGTCYIFCDYYRMKISMPGTNLLQNEIEDQRSQIQAFSEEINTLKQDMLKLKRLDEKIRIIANMKPRDKQAIFGIGGPLPEDLDANLPLTKKHNALVRDMHEQLEHLTMASDLQMKSFQDLVVSLEDQKSFLAATPSIRPTVGGWLSSRFGYRTSPFTGRREFHKGLDIAARVGTSIIAPASGVVTFTGKKGSYGLVLIINHGHGVVTRYGHLKKSMIKVGDRVKRGEKVALVGSSGRSTGPHVHYEVNVNGIPVNPEKYILD